MTDTLNNALITAAQQGNLTEVQALIDQGADANFDYGASYVLAVANSHREVADVLYPLTNEDVRAMALEIAAWNSLPDMIDDLYQKDHAQAAVQSLTNAMERNGGQHAIELLKQKLLTDSGTETSAIARRTFKR